MKLLYNFLIKHIGAVGISVVAALLASFLGRWAVHNGVGLVLLVLISPGLIPGWGVGALLSTSGASSTVATAIFFGITLLANFGYYCLLKWLRSKIFR